MSCELKPEKASNIAGVTLWGESCSRQTAVYLPSIALLDNSLLNLVLWFHGFYVSSYQNIFQYFSDNAPDKNGDCRLRQSVLASKQDVVLIAPFLGKVPYKPGPAEIAQATTPDAKENIEKRLQAYRAGVKKYQAAEARLGDGKNGFFYLQEILDAIGSYRDQLKGVTPAKPPGLGNLYLACHSGGGEGMLEAIGSLGNFKDNLKECWGFDCIYSTNYALKVTSNPKIMFYLYFGQGSSFEATYDLYAKKYGTPKDPPAANMNNVFVAPAAKWAGVDDDIRAFQSVDAIKKSPQNAPTYEKFRQDLDTHLGRKDQWTKFLNNNRLSLRGHYTVPATLFEPRIKQTFGKSKGT